MGVFQSKDKLPDESLDQENKTVNVVKTVKSTDENKICTSSDKEKIASLPVIEKNENPNLSDYNESQTSLFNSGYKLKQPPKLDFTELENENPIERRKRIMSGDRRTSYVMKLESLRRAHLERELNEANQSSKLSAEETVLPNKVSNYCSTSKDIYSDMISDLRKMNSDYFTSQPKQSEDSDLKICGDNYQVVVEKCNSKLPKVNNENQTVKFPPDMSVEGENSTNNIMQSENKKINSSLESQAENKNWTDIVKKLKEKHNDIRTVSLPNELGRFSTSYNPEQVFNKFQNEESENILSSSPNEIHGKLITFKKLDENKTEFDDSIEKPINPSHEQENKLFKTLSNEKSSTNFSIFNLPRFFTRCFSAVCSSSDISNQSSKNIANSLGSSDVTNFESDHKVNRIDSGIKSCDSNPDNENSKNVIMDNDNSSGVELNCSNSSATHLTYKRVKRLFQKRIAEYENEERKIKIKTNNSCYKELEELGRGHWKDGVWIPFGNAVFQRNI